MSNYQKCIISVLSILITVSLAYLYLSHKQPSSVTLIKTPFSQLPHWEQDNHLVALIAFKMSCSEVQKRNPSSAFGPMTESLTVKNWQSICSAAIQLTNPDDQTAKHFFETWFQPYFVKSNPKTDHLFTGYYIPLLEASLKKTKEFNIPIYGLPNDLIKVNLSSFNVNTSNKVIIGQLKQDRLIPYPDRSAIINGAINNNAPILAWTNNEIDLFFAQIQGSAFIKLPDEHEILLGYAGTNGRPYTAIGKILMASNAIKKSDISMQSIRAWLEEHPDQMTTTLNHNASYIFFKFSKTPNPIGNEGVPLTPGRSLAVDKSYVSLGTPIWLSTVTPTNNHAPEPFQHLVIAQDTGGAIKGAVRGDVYWGTGEEAAFLAGHMQSHGQYWLLLPKPS